MTNDIPRYPAPETIVELENAEIEPFPLDPVRYVLSAERMERIEEGANVAKLRELIEHGLRDALVTPEQAQELTRFLDSY